MSEWLPVAVLAMTIPWIRRVTAGASSPAILVTVLWSVAIALPSVFAPEFRIWMPGVWLLVLFVAVFSLSALIGERLAPLSPVSAVENLPCASTCIPNIDPRPIRIVLLWASTLGIAAVYALLREEGKVSSNLFTLSGWFETASRFAVARYEDNYEEPIAARLMSVGFYFGALLGGTLFSFSRHLLNKIVSFLPIVVALAYSAVMTTRAPFLFAVLMWCSALLAVRTCESGRRGLQLAFGRAIVVAVASLIAVLLVFILLQSARGGHDGFEDLADNMIHLRTWFFSHVSSFSLWMRHAQLGGGEPLRYGERTFGGAFQLLGIGQRRLGVFEPIDIGGGRESNVFTAFRSLVEDFGVPGALLVTFVSGLLAGDCYRRVCSGKSRDIPLLVSLYCYVLWSPVGSFFAYNSLIVSLVLFRLLFLRLTQYHHRPCRRDWQGPRV